MSERFVAHGIVCEQSAEPKSSIYGALLPLLNAGRVELLDVPRLHAQLLSLERRTSRQGRDSIDHPPNAHDDLINAAAGALVAAQPGDGADIRVVSQGGFVDHLGDYQPRIRWDREPPW